MKYLLAPVLLGTMLLSSGCLVSSFKNATQTIQANSSTGILGCTRRGDTLAIADLLKNNPGVLNEKIGGDYIVPLSVVQDIATTEWLLAHGADPNIMLHDGVTPFLQHVYHQNANTDILDALLRHGANINQGVGSSAYDRLGTNNNGDGKHFFKNAKETKDGVTITDFRQKNETPLHYSTIYGNIAYMNMLIAHGATVDVREDAGYTPLHLACEAINLEATKVLLAHGADINAKDDDEETPLKLCLTSSSTHDKTQLLAYLREHGASE